MNQHILPLKHPNLSPSLGDSLPDLPQKSPQNLPLENILPFVVERPKGHQKAITDRSRRLGRISHLRQQNIVGAGLVTNFMDEMCSFITGVERDLESALNKAWVPEMFGFKGSPLS